MSQAVREQMARIALLDHRIAELMAERARVFDELARGEVNLPQMRKAAKAHVPEIPEPTEIDRARARKVLARNEVRRRVGR